MALFDKENSQLSVLSHLRTPGPLSAPVGKVFQQNGIANGATPGRTLGAKSFIFPVQSSTPRRALGDLKNTVTPNGNKPGGLSLKPTGSTFQKPAPVMKLSVPGPASKPSRPKQQDRQKLTMKKPEATAQQVPQNLVEPVEMMDIHQEEDDFEDIWAAKERPATYIKQLKDWRPSRLLPVARTQEEEEEWERQLLQSDDDDEEELVSRVRHLTVEEPDLDMNIPIPESDFMPLDLIALPALDDLFCLDNFTFGKFE